MAGYIGSGASVVSSGAENKKVFDITTNTTSLTGLNYTVGKVHVYHNGVRLVDGTDYTANNSTSITLTVAAVSGDQVVVVSYASFQVAGSYTEAEADARFVNDPSSVITVDGSNVGIGTSSPSSPKFSSGASGVLELKGTKPSFNVQESDVTNAHFNMSMTNGNAYLGATGTGNLVFATGTSDWSERMRIDSSGRVTTPNQPAFSIFADGGFDYTSNVIYRGQSPSSSSFDTNIGNHFSYTTGKFTAPVAGTYFFSFCATTGDTNSHFIDIHKNGARVGGHTLSYGNSYITATNTAVLTLASGDYIEARRRATGYSIYSANFSGYLIG